MFAVSLGLQALGVAVLVLLPLLNTYEIDPGAWALARVGLAPPPPPPPAPAPAAPSVAPPPRRYVSQFQAPSAIPDRVASLNDAGFPGDPLAGQPAPQGLDGGLGEPGVPGVLGMPLLSGSVPPLPLPVRIGGNIQNARIVSRALPVYPLEAVEQHLTGTVKLEAIIGIDGAVRDLQVVDGHPLLAAAAVEAVSQWRYRPTLLNGKRVEVVTLIEVNFNLTLPEETDKQNKGRRGRQARR